MKHFRHLIKPYLIWAFFIIVIPLALIALYAFTEEGNSVLTLSFTLAVSDQTHGESMTNCLPCAYGDTLTVSLTGSAEKGYTIARAD